MVVYVMDTQYTQLWLPVWNGYLVCTPHVSPYYLSEIHSSGHFGIQTICPDMQVIRICESVQPNGCESLKNKP